MHVLRSLGADPSLYGSRLARDFQLMARELGKPFNGRIPAASVFRRENGRPQLIKNADGAWVRLVSR